MNIKPKFPPPRIIEEPPLDIGIIIAMVIILTLLIYTYL